MLGGGFYSTRLSIELRKNAGLVYSVGSTLQAGRTRGAYFIDYACDPQNVGKAASIVGAGAQVDAETPPGADELLRVKALLLRQIPLAEASVEGIAHRLLERREYDLPLDEPTLAARRYIALDAGGCAGRIQEVDASRRSGARQPGPGATIVRAGLLDSRTVKEDSGGRGRFVFQFDVGGAAAAGALHWQPQSARIERSVNL